MDIRTNTSSPEPLSFEKVWLMFQETNEKFQQTDKKFQEMRAESLKLDKKYQKRIDALNDLFTGQWGKLVESLVEGKLVPLLKERNIDIETTYTRVVNESKEMEIDIIAANGNDVVAVEVKTTLKLDDINYFLEKMARFKDSFKHFKDNRLFGAVAFLKADVGLIKKAEKLGLFVIKATGDSAKLVNKPDFTPKAW